VTVLGLIAARKAALPQGDVPRARCVAFGYHAWERRETSARAREDAGLSERIEQIHSRSRRAYGSPRMHAELRFDGVRVGRKRVERLMRGAGLSGLIRRRRGKTTIRAAGVRTTPDLVQRDFAPRAVNRLWSADITYLRTGEALASAQRDTERAATDRARTSSIPTVR
jgi:putative transposase